MLIFKEIPAGAFRKHLQQLGTFVWADQVLALPKTSPAVQLFSLLRAELDDEKWIILLSWSFLDGLRDALDVDCDRFGQLLEEWRMLPLLRESMRGLGFSQTAQPTRLLACQKGWLKRFGRRTPDKLLTALLENEEVRSWLQLNIYEGKRWFNREAFETWWFYLSVEGLLEILNSKSARGKKIERLERTAALLLNIRESAFASGFELERWLELLVNPDDQE